jgi:hypothetical protein
MKWRNATEIFRMLKVALGKQKMGQTGYVSGFPSSKQCDLCSRC